MAERSGGGEAVGNDWTGNGLELGSDVPGREFEPMEESGSSGKFDGMLSTDEEGIGVRNNQIKRKIAGKEQDGSGDMGKRTRKEQSVREYKVLVKLLKEGTNFDDWSPALLTVALQKAFGEVSAKKIRSGLLMVCKDEEQQKRAIKVGKLNGFEIKCTVASDRRLVKGVISGIPLSESVDVIKESITNVKVREARRLKTKRDGALTDSLSIVLTFDEPELPRRVLLGYMSYDVRLYIPPPLRCFKCQRFGHIANDCKGKQRCSKCGGEHDYGKCDTNATMKCCNCGGEHSAAYRGCEVSKRMQEVQRVKVTQGVSYAEAVRSVEKVKVVANSSVPNEGGEEQKKSVPPVDDGTMVVSETNFVLFMATVVNCTAQAGGRTEKLQIIVSAAKKYLNFKNMRWEAVRDALAESMNQSQECVAGTG